MDRSMKVMFGMMTFAFCLMAFTMIGNQIPQAYAGEFVGGGDRGTEPTIVSFRVTPISRDLHETRTDNGKSWAWGNNPTSWVLLTRMWSDGVVEVNIVGSETLGSTGAIENETFTGWKTVTDSVAGYACVGDTDGNRDVNITDLLAVVDEWGQCEEDPPAGLSDDPDLM